ncbi:MAG: leucine-rich repeat protein [Acutalibacteraceae bacterium]|jgi:hypothetical protein
MKKFVSIMLSLVMLLTCLPVMITAETGGKVGDLDWTFADGVLTISGEGDMPNFTDGVTPWQGYGFTKLVIEEGVTSIGNAAFYHADDLQQAVLPDSLTRLGRSAFAQCGMLTDVQIPDGVTVIESGTFRVCQSLKSIVIPDGVTTIEYFAFENCSAMESIIIPASVTAILEDMVFVDCDALTIYGYTGSYAEEYADKNGIPFAALDAADPDPEPGDVDGNGEVTAADALMALQAATGKIELVGVRQAAADVDGNGAVSAADALAILQFATGKITSFSPALDPEKTVTLAVPAGSPYARRADGNGFDARITAAMAAAEKELGITFVAREYESGAAIPSADLVVAPIWQQRTLVPAGTLRDLNGVNGLDLTAAGWDQTALRDMRLYSKNFLAVPSLTGPKESAGVIYFNKKLAKLVGTNADELYQLVRDGEWTFAKMWEFSAKALRDIDGVAGIDYLGSSGKDQYGFTGVNMRRGVSHALFRAYGGAMTRPDGKGGLTYALGDAVSIDALTHMQKWLLGDKSVFNADMGGNNPAIGVEIFKDGRALFLGWSADKAETFADMSDDWGILPYPKGRVGSGDYTATVDWSVQGFCIPKQTDGAALERAVAALNTLAVKLEAQRVDRAAQCADLFDGQTPAMLAIAAQAASIGGEQFADLGAGGMATVQYLFDDITRDPATRVANVEEEAIQRLNTYLNAVK